MDDNLVTILIAIISSGIFNKILDKISDRRKEDRQEEKDQNKECKMLEASLRLLMKDRLRFLCMHYIRQGWIYEDELEDIMNMHSMYHNELHGNGFLDKQMEKVTSLEVRGIGVK